MTAEDSLLEVLERRAANRDPWPAVTWRPDSGADRTLTYAQLRERAARVALRLMDLAGPGDRALVVLDNAVDFAVAFFGCLMAGVVPVPLPEPRRGRSLERWTAAIADCTPRALVTNAACASRIGADAVCAQMKMDVAYVEQEGTSQSIPPHRTHHVALLQYTSGSTALPRGVVVSQANVMANLEALREGMALDARDRFVSWAPLHHDMGLILNLLAPIYVGAPVLLMSPASFLMRPLRWLRAIHELRARVAGGPNFAFDHCVDRVQAEALEGLDLSSWTLAFNGAEMVRATTMKRFAERFRRAGFDETAFYPCYGLAEATLFVSGGERGSGWTTDPDGRVVCGRPAPGVEIAIVDPRTCERLGAGVEGEIWVRGPSVAAGYWGQADAAEQTFRAELANDLGRPWLRTGDLGRLHADGGLSVTGRIKDLIVIRGANHHPQDIEATVQAAHPSLRAGRGAAFASVGPDGGERLVIIQEIGKGIQPAAFAEIVADVREAVIEAHDLAPYEIALVAAGSLPLTTSGKVPRSMVRTQWEASRAAPGAPQP
jgi:acyl-CoA synthetase (AMP-forming)/AMP-acid ligase II